MKRLAMWLTTVTTILVLGGQVLGGALPVLESAGVFVGTNTPAAQAAVEVATGRAPTGVGVGAAADAQVGGAPSGQPVIATVSAVVETAASGTAPATAACPADITGVIGTAPARVAGGGLIGGTTSADLATFAVTYNSIRIANCLPAVPSANFRYDACLESRLVWMAEDPSSDPTSAWGHLGSVRSDGAPSVGCDGNLAGGSDNDAATMATKWWDSLSHRDSLYKPDFTGATDRMCVFFAMTHGGVPDEPSTFTRAAARIGTC